MKKSVGLMAAAVVAAAGTSAMAQGEYIFRDRDGNITQSRGDHSVARMWNEVLLDGIRTDLARPTIHARNLFHISIAMWDAWAAFDEQADTYINHEFMPAVDVKAAREEAISYAAFRMIEHRFANSPGAAIVLGECEDLMNTLGYDTSYTATDEQTPASLGNRIAAMIIDWGLSDGSNEANGYANQFYAPVNEPLLPDFPGNPDITDVNRWQPLALDYFVDQGGNVIIGGYPDFLSPEWGQVDAFALREQDRTVYNRDGFDYQVFHDPGEPPKIGADDEDYYRWGFEMVSIWSAHLDPADGVMMDISPASLGNAPLPDPDEWASYYDLYEGSDWSQGWDLNPATGEPYAPQIVHRGDYSRILAEFWADGPDSETPPGHWFTILNYVVDHPMSTRQFRGEGPELDSLEYDVKAYLVLGTAMHDVAVSAWGVKGWYDYLRPISAIRYMADQGQATDPNQPSYNPDGIDLHPGFIEVITAETTAPGERHEHLAGYEGEIALYAWRGPDYINDPDNDVAGVGWIRAGNWWPYQRPSFVTPPFAGYISGHSTFSRAAADVMTLLTGSEFFPGGMGEFYCPQNQFLVFEDGPSTDVTLQWATYQDASDQTSMSRIWGGIHPPADDIPGRHMGGVIGPDAFHHALSYMDGRISCPADFAAPYGSLDYADLLDFLDAFDAEDPSADLAAPYREFNIFDVLEFLNVFSSGC